LKKVIALATLGGVALVAVNPRLGTEEGDHPIPARRFWVGLGIAFLVGIYGGFFGIMAGTFALYVLLFIFKQSFLRGAATAKISSFMLATTAAVVFAWKGAIHYRMAAALFSGCAIGSYIGAHYSDRVGNVWIRRLFIAIVLVMVVKLLIP
jgi:uncharacterized membrane protein YfcA